MAAFSTNQNRQMYVGQLGTTSTHVTTLANAGDLKVASIGEGNDKQVYFEYINKKMEVIKSDYIPVKNIDYVKPFKASSMATPLKKVEVTLDGDINSGAPIVGQDYVLGITFRQWIGMSDQDVYYKDAAVHVTSATNTASTFYKEMVKQLNRAFAREVGANMTSNPYLKFAIYGTTAAGELEETDAGFSTDTATKIVITEKPQDYSIGTEAQERVYFDVNPTTVLSGSEDVIWGKTTDATPAKADAVVGTNALGNGAQIADLEHFCLGERGDQYRNVGWPNVVITEGLADATKQYNVFEIHYAFTDTGVNSYRSEKDITIAVPLGAAGHLYDNINALIDEFEYHSGLTIAGLSD